MYADESIYGLTICSPLTGNENDFQGSFCADVSPTVEFTAEDNYLRNMYLSKDDNSTNYVISDDTSIVRIFVFNNVSGKGISRLSFRACQ